jgi:uncharacterized membrane protein YqjE
MPRRGDEAMTTDVKTGPETSITALVGDIITGFQDLVKQQLNLFRVDIQNDLRKAKEFTLAVSVGLGLALTGVGLLCVMLPLLLYWALPEMPLWVSYGIVGLVFAVLGASLVYGGLNKFESINPMQGPSVESLKENARWTTNPK